MTKLSTQSRLSGGGRGAEDAVPPSEGGVELEPRNDEEEANTTGGAEEVREHWEKTQT